MLQQKIDVLRGGIINGLRPGDEGYERALRRAAESVSIDELGPHSRTAADDKIDD